MLRPLISHKQLSEPSGTIFLIVLSIFNLKGLSEKLGVLLYYFIFKVLIMLINKLYNDIKYYFRSLSLYKCNVLYISSYIYYNL